MQPRKPINFKNYFIQLILGMILVNGNVRLDELLSFLHQIIVITSNNTLNSKDQGFRIDKVPSWLIEHFEIFISLLVRSSKWSHFKH